MPELQQVFLSEIEMHGRLRPLNPEAVASLALSISRMGLMTPISVRIIEDERGETPVLIAGYHRLKAMRSLNHETAMCMVHGGDEADARLWEIAENLHRAELSVQERAEHIAEWVRLTDQKAQVAPIESKRADGRGHRQEGGINSAVRELGIDRTEAQRAIKIAAIAPEAKAAAQEAGIDDNQAALLRVAKEANPAAQLAAIRKEQDQAEAHKRNRDTDRVIALTESQLFGEWLMHQAASSEVPMVISWLECCKAKDVIAAMRREAA